MDSAAYEYAVKNGFDFVLSKDFDPNNLSAGEKTTEKPTETVKPTADGNGEIDILDVITINKAVMGKEVLSDEQNKAADVNGSGVPDSGDSLQILKLIVGIITEL